MTLRAATVTDAPALANIVGHWFEVTPYVPRLHSATEDEAFISALIRSQDVLVHAQNEVDGFIARDGIEIGQLYVAQGARNRGIGSRLLDAMKNRATALQLWCFQANKDARRFYERHGFSVARITDGAENEERRPDMLYRWRRQQ